MRHSLPIACALFTALLGLSEVASAEPREYRYDRYDRHDASEVTLGAQAEYGAWTGDGSTNLYSWGVGVRGGVTFYSGLYIGADFDWFSGDHQSRSLGGASASSRLNVYDVMGEIGYDFWLHRHGVLRPKIGLGVGVEKASACAGVAGVGGGCDERSQSGFAIAPGVQYLHFFYPLYLSLEARYQTVSVDGPDPSAFIFGAGLGISL
jgi:hypothetical protein